MAVTVELRRPGKNGRCWLLHPRSPDERLRLVRQAHLARCGGGLPIRAVQRELEENGALVARGTVSNWLAWYCCELCDDGRPAAVISLG